MRYKLDVNGYVLAVFWGCYTGTCAEYTGEVPAGYSSLIEWADNALINAYYIDGSGNLVLDAAREAELKAKNGGGEEAPAQEAMDIKALLFDINTMQDELNIVKESLLPDDEEIEAFEESLKEKVTEFGDKFNAKVYGAVCDIYRKPDGAINKKIAKVEKEIAKIEEVLKNREEERDRTTVLRIVKQSAAVALAPWVYSIIINFSKNAQPSFLLKQTLRADKILLSKL